MTFIDIFEGVFMLFLKSIFVLYAIVRLSRLHVFRIFRSRSRSRSSQLESNFTFYTQKDRKIVGLPMKWVSFRVLGEIDVKKHQL